MRVCVYTQNMENNTFDGCIYLSMENMHKFFITVFFNHLKSDVM